MSDHLFRAAVGFAGRLETLLGGALIGSALPRLAIAPAGRWLAAAGTAGNIDLWRLD